MGRYISGCYFAMAWERSAGQKSPWRVRYGRILLALLAGALFNLVFSSSAPAAPNDDDELVYLDPEGFIRVLDPQPPTDLLEVTWTSPEGGWGDFQLADVTDDGDMEIVAVRPDGEDGRLVIFDPVAIGADDDEVQFIDGVPWQVLFDAEYAGNPRIIGVGELDTTRPGPEIIYSFVLEEDERIRQEDWLRFVVLRQVDDDGDGDEWEVQATFDTGNEWSFIATGNLDAQGVDEVALVANRQGNLNVYRVGDQFEQIYRHSSADFRWRVARFGQFNSNTQREELFAVREADYPLASAWVFGWEGDTLVDQYAAQFIPSPSYLFLADIAGNGDDEMVMLRNVPQEIRHNPPRLFIRDNNNDDVQLNDVRLDADNGYKVGAGGDFDGDVRDEIAIMRNNLIRIYTEPEASNANLEFDVETDSAHLLAGNLDMLGLVQEPLLAASSDEITARLQAGTAGESVSVSVQDAAQGTEIPFLVALEGVAEWLNVTTSSLSTPSTLTLTPDASNLAPGVYSGNVVVNAEADNIRNDPLRIYFELTVESGVTTTPQTILFDFYPCDEPLEAGATRSLNVEGAAGAAFTAAVEGNPPWVSVSPQNGVLPEILTLTANPEERPGDFVAADVIVTVALPNTDGVDVRRPVHLQCPADRLSFPSLLLPATPAAR